MRKAITFLTALTIKQNAPHIAIEILSSIRMVRYIDIRCLKVLAYIELKKFTEIVPILRMSLESDRLTAPKECYFQDVVCIQVRIRSDNTVRITIFFFVDFQIDKLEKALADENIPESFELYKLIDLLKKNNYIDSEVSFPANKLSHLIYISFILFWSILHYIFC